MKPTHAAQHAFRAKVDVTSDEQRHTLASNASYGHHTRTANKAANELSVPGALRVPRCSASAEGTSERA